MKQKTERSLLLFLLCIGLACAWFAPLDGASAQAVDAGLKRALVSFASARALNAVLSVAQSASISVGVAGLSIGQALRPINELVGQFAELMLAASVAFGTMKLLIVIGSYKGLSLLLTVVALWWAWLRWQAKVPPTLLSKLLLILVLMRFAIPVATLGSEAVFEGFLSSDYKVAQHGIADIPSPPSVLGPAPGKDAGERSVLDKMKEWVPDLARLRVYVDNLKLSAEKWVEHMISLIAVFVLQTLVLPLFLFWLLYRVMAAVLQSEPNFKHGRSERGDATF
ncbi:hypothetical protein BH11PSE11_BH11PSE11_01590 [soil metagenome]